jgi:hypothetical protein
MGKGGDDARADCGGKLRHVEFDWPPSQSQTFYSFFQNVRSWLMDWSRFRTTALGT